MAFSYSTLPSLSLQLPCLAFPFPSKVQVQDHVLKPCCSSSQAAVSAVFDENAPEGRDGLRGFLYGDSGADIHNTEIKRISLIDGEDDGSCIVDLDSYISSRDGLKFAGVFSVYDRNSNLQYVGYSRNVVLYLKSHLSRLGKEKCFMVRAKAYTNSAMVTKHKLEEEREKWLREVGTFPPGNSAEKHLWDVTDGEPLSAAMSEAEKVEYQEKKLNLRKAIGENLYDDVEGEEDDARNRRLTLLQATEGDEGSKVIDGQTRSMIDLKSDENNTKAVASISSPFTNKTQNEGPQITKGLYSADTFELTMDNVDMVLNDVRPYLLADGGNVDVISVDNGVISLRLQGACGTCPSSTVTMKMGIERVLKEKFGESFKEVIQVDQQQIGANVKSVDAHLEMLRPAIHNYSGFVEVISVEGGECKVKYKGPPSIGMGIQAAIKDKFPDITSVILIDT